MYYQGMLITAQYGEYCATYDGNVVATAPSKQELFCILDGIVARYQRNK